MNKKKMLEKFKEWCKKKVKEGKIEIKEEKKEEEIKPNYPRFWDGSRRR